MMKALIQRVTQAKVTVDGETVSSIGKGLCVLIGITHKDSPKEMEYMVRKILNLRLFDDDQGKRWAKNVMEKNFEVLCVSQFTLCTILKGNRPDFHAAMAPEQSQEFYAEFVKQMGETYDPSKIKDGVFGAYMQVHIQNDGPVTIPLETPISLQEEGKKQKKWNNPKNQSSNASKSTPVQQQSSVPVSGPEVSCEGAEAMSSEPQGGTESQQDQS
ncbi:D-tyrosyl-tRNA(Tyr) deacylase 1-like [Mizuhopecten yessoensis]|uniref:D-aminoacyl-tRNA deacylase n=1 Tax=Mizuhopecten yessoensis TaxID=6573 RepID=A0A210PVY3_MIZYE|nr:D-tyrosyl-tRNA(Tyr) deacylase 1-like [Mizuhopecten yessoensis]OWF40658.1 D-tyrosyl-tRNA(Tyr) deacylase 1 [Mizuhopecten yessoensis]